MYCDCVVWPLFGRCGREVPVNTNTGQSEAHPLPRSTSIAQTTITMIIDDFAAIVKAVQGPVLCSVSSKA
eukprot:4277547-Prymnesium_polylepis.1